MSVRTALLVVLVAGATACGAEAEESAGPIPPRAVGLVVELDADGADVRGFILEADGRRYDVRIDPEIDYGFDLVHLREHQRLEQPVEVALERRGDDVYATEILDA